MGPYCRFCDRRCFVPRVLPDKGQSLIMATCEKGAAHDRRATGYDHTTALNPADRSDVPVWSAPEEEAPVASDPTAPVPHRPDPTMVEGLGGMYVQRDPSVRALRWLPADPATVGRMIVWLDGLDRSPVVRRGVGASSVLSVATSSLKRTSTAGMADVNPGDWVVVYPEGRLETMPDALFAEMFTTPEEG